MQAYELSTESRLSSWKNLRTQLSYMDEAEQLQKVASYWSYFPLSNIAYDIDNPASWLTPWEMVSEGEWCRHSIAIAMEFTLRLAGWDKERLSLKLIKDYSNHDIFFVVEVDNKFWLNYDFGMVCEKPSIIYATIKEYYFNGKKYN